MEMYNTSDYLRVNRIYKIPAVENVTMYINPDKKEERRKEERKYTSSSSKKMKKSADEKREYANVQRQAGEAVRPKKTASVQDENALFSLWVYMTAKHRQTVLQKEENMDTDKRMEKYMAAQQKVVIQPSCLDEEGISFNAKA